MLQNKQYWLLTSLIDHLQTLKWPNVFKCNKIK
jgi:hypothetical protein